MLCSCSGKFISPSFLSLWVCVRRRSRMKPLLCSLLLLFAFSLSAQVPVAVPAAKEPHHHHVLEHSYVRATRASVPAHDATRRHQHDMPYSCVALSPGDVINAV